MFDLMTTMRETDFSSASYPTLQWLHDLAMVQDDTTAYALFLAKRGAEYLAVAKHAYITMR